MKSISNGAALIVLVLLLLSLSAFAATHQLWYDRLEVGQRVSFWNDALVAYGTLALAVVTWASVRETQTVVIGEDLRFRQSKMPVLKIARLEYGLTTCEVTISNIGDGPARNVRIELETTADWQYSNDGGNVRDQAAQSVFSGDIPAATYLPPGTDISVKLIATSRPKPTLISNYELSTTVEKAIIRYEDVFLAGYGSLYDTSSSEFNNDQFYWVAPPKLLKSSV